MNKLYVVMPAYNEAGIIEKVVQEWHAVVDSVGHGSRLIVLNDGSTDETSAILESIKTSHPNLTVINKTNSGHGPTCLAAYKFAVDEGADWVFQTDADGQTQSGEFWKFWEKRDTCDFIIGWRARRADGPSRVFISRILKGVLALLFNVSLKDANAPFRLMKAERLRLYLPLIPDNFFIPNVLLSAMLTREGEKILWQEISFNPRNAGQSSIALFRFGGLGIKLIIELYKLRHLKLVT